MLIKGPGSITDGLNANSESIDASGVFPVAAAGTISTGQVFTRDLTAQVSNLLPLNTGPSTLYQPAGDTLVKPSSTNSGDVFGVYQGGAYTNSTGAQASFAGEVFRIRGIGKVLAGSVLTSGVQIRVGDSLIVNTTTDFAVAGARAFGNAIGRVVAYPIQGQIPLATSTGAQTVVVALPAGAPAGTYLTAGITTSTPITVDSGANQEIVTPTAVSSTGFTAVFTKAHGTNTPIFGLASAVNAVILPANATGTATQVLVLADINV